MGNPQCVAWLSRLVQIPSVNPLHDGPNAGVVGEAAIASAVGNWLTDLGATVELIDAAPGRPNVYGWVPGRSERLVVFDVHLDTVTVENMVEDPFDGRVHDGSVWGRGALDTKASMGVMLALLESWKRDGLRPDPSVLVLGSASEEAGGLLGATAFRALADERGLAIDEIVVCEPTELSAVFGHKGGVAYNVTVRGQSAHSARPELGVNAIYGAARAIAAIEAEGARLATVIGATPVGAGTVSVGVINGGIAANVVPDQCRFVMGRRVAPEEDPAEIGAALRALVVAAVAPCVVEFEELTSSRGFCNSPETPLAQALSSAAGTKPTTAPFGTNALRYAGLSRDMVIFGPGCIDDAHKPTESVRIDDLLKAEAALTFWLRPA